MLPGQRAPLRLYKVIFGDLLRVTISFARPAPGMARSEQIDGMTGVTIESRKLVQVGISYLAAAVSDTSVESATRAYRWKTELFSQFP